MYVCVQSVFFFLLGSGDPSLVKSNFVSQRQRHTLRFGILSDTGITNFSMSSSSYHATLLQLTSSYKVLEPEEQCPITQYFSLTIHAAGPALSQGHDHRLDHGINAGIGVRRKDECHIHT